MKNHKIAGIGLGLSVTLFLVVLLCEVELFERTVHMLHSLEEYQFDELIIPIMLSVIFVLVDLLHWKKRHDVDREKITIYKAMVNSAHHVLNNFLNQMQLFKMTAERTPGFDPKILSLYGYIMKEAMDQIAALSSVREISERSIMNSISPKLKDDAAIQQSLGRDSGTAADGHDGAPRR